MRDSLEVSSTAAAEAPSQPEGATVHVWLFGGLSKFVAERPSVLNMPDGFAARDVIAEMAKRCGPDFISTVMETPGRMTTCCKIFLDGQPVDDISRPLKTDGYTAEWEMIVLTGEPGG